MRYYLEIAIGEGLSPPALRVAVEHDGQIFINGHELAKRLTFDQLLCASFAQDVGECPVGILDVD